ncbi:MAG: ABC transporter permease [Caldilineaceae bacterium]
MAQATFPLASDSAIEEAPSKSSGAGVRIARYALVRIATQAVTVVIAVYLSIILANMGGQVDEIRKGVIQEETAMYAGLDPKVQLMTPEQKKEHIDKLVALAEKKAGLDTPFIVRSFLYLKDGLTLSLGRAQHMHSDSGSSLVRLIILERLPPTLLLFTTAQLLLFFSSLFMGLYLSRNYGNWIDKLNLALAPTSAAPSWFYALFLILFFAGVLGVLPFGGMVAAPPPADTLGYALSVLKHLILPVFAVAISAIFAAIYGSRTFFLIYSKEDYVEMAQAKGLHPRTIERRYILRPTLPIIVTGFALGIISLWTGSVTLETIFNWPGLGRLLFQAASIVDTPVIIGVTVIYAYLLAITVFLLDIAYALLDPRVKVGAGGAK